MTITLLLLTTTEFRSRYFTLCAIAAPPTLVTNALAHLDRCQLTTTTTSTQRHTTYSSRHTCAQIVPGNRGTVFVCLNAIYNNCCAHAGGQKLCERASVPYATPKSVYNLAGRCDYVGYVDYVDYTMPAHSTTITSANGASITHSIPALQSTKP